MLQIVFRKLASNVWIVLCLLLGSILAVGMVCSIPIYSNGILQRMLTRDLELTQEETSIYPGYLALENFYGKSSTSESAPFRTKMLTEIADLSAMMPVEPTLTEEFLSIDNLYHTVVINDKKIDFNFSTGSLTHFQDHVTIIKGRFSEPKLVNGVLEVIASEKALATSGMVMDRAYYIYSHNQKKGAASLIKIKIVGLFEASDLQDVYWYKSINSLSRTLVIDSNLLMEMSSQFPEMPITNQKVYAAFDYHKFSINSVDKLEAISKVCKDFGVAYKHTTDYYSTFHYFITFDNIVAGYSQRAAELKMTLQIMIVPILLMLIFYIFMVSQLKVRNETAIISVMESRGAGRSQILLLYTLESFFMGGLTLIAGPPLGYLMVRIIGSANGFMEFVNRKALMIRLDNYAMLYGLLSVILIIITTLLPVFQWSRVSIVQQKQKKSRLLKASLWQRLFLDIIFLAISLYALNLLKAQLKIQQQIGLAGTEANLNFLLFLASTLFILGGGLLLLRLHPWILRFISLLGRRIWHPVLYLSFHQISRSNGQSQFLMIFLILALSIGLFNANAARTINQNTDDNIRCKVGSDIVLQEYWQKDYALDGQPVLQDTIIEEADMRYLEPDFNRYTKMAGIEHATRVYRSDDVRINTSSAVSNKIALMSIDPYDFALTAWTRNNLNNYTMNEYMNVMIGRSNAVILSSNLREEMKLKVGDDIIYSLNVNGANNIEGVIIAFVDAWPGYQPLTYNTDGEPVKNSLLVSRLDYFLNQSLLRPYEIWINKKADVTDKALYDELKAADISITSLDSATQLITTAKNDPQLQGTNGALTLGFIVSMLICAVGFLIYWILSVQGRTLQFGILRAIGLGKGSIISMLVAEQVLVSGAAIFFGIILGNLSSWLYVPLFQLVYNSSGQSVPFRVVSEASDSMKIYIILGCLLAVCIMLLVWLILRIRVDQAVKLGEE